MRETQSAETAPRRPPPPGPNPTASTAAAAGPKDGFLSPRFRSAAALAGWDEEALLHAALVVEDTPVRESRHRKRPPGGSTDSNTRKRRSRRRQPDAIPPVVLSLDDDEKADAGDAMKEMGEEEKKATVVEEKKATVVEEKKVLDSAKAATGNSELPCMDRLREELSCAICLEICFEPSTTPCGHSFCMKCLKHAAAKCGKRCPKCRQLISNARSCTVNTVLWNTIQLLFPNEVETRRASISASTSSNEGVHQSPPRSNSFTQVSTRRSNTGGRNFITQASTSNSSSTRRSFITQGSTRSSNSGRGFVRASQLVTARISSVSSGQQSEDAALAYRLQQEEFMTAFATDRDSPPRSTVSTARANLRAMASRAIRLRSRGWPV